MGHTEGEGPVQTEAEMGRCRQESRSTKIAGSCQRSAGKESVCSAGDLGSIPGSGRSPGEGKGYPLQCCGLENSVDYIVHGVAKSMGSDTTERLSLHSLEIRKQGGARTPSPPPSPGGPALPTPVSCPGMLIPDFRSPEWGGKGISVVLSHPCPSGPSLWLFVWQPRERNAM